MIHVRQFGYAGLPGGVTPTFVQVIARSNNQPGSLINPMTITTITPTLLGINGGVIVTVTGTGFPLEGTNYPKLTIKDF